MVTLADWVPGPKQGEWTYSDYAALPDDGQRSVEVLVLESEKYRSLGVFRGQETLPSRIVPEMPVHVDQFFA